MVLGVVGAPALTAPDDDAIDAALLARWRGGDERAATELVQRHAPALARFAASLGERAEVDELVQDTLLKGWQQGPRPL